MPILSSAPVERFVIANDVVVALVRSEYVAAKLVVVAFVAVKFVANKFPAVSAVDDA